LADESWGSGHHEDITDGRDRDFAEAKKLLTAADQIILMGFGYNAVNVERLGITDLPEVQRY